MLNGAKYVSNIVKLTGIDGSILTVVNSQA